MDGWTDGQKRLTDGWISGQMDGWMDGWTNTLMSHRSLHLIIQSVNTVQKDDDGPPESLHLAWELEIQS